MSISKKEIKQLDSYFRCANYLSVGQLYLLDNPLLKEELKWGDVKKKIVGHCAACNAYFPNLDF